MKTARKGWSFERRLAFDARKEPAAAVQLAVWRFLKSHGYSVMMIGEVQVRSWAGDITGKRAVRVDFLGGKISERKRTPSDSASPRSGVVCAWRVTK